jgi:hypothetical protein
VDSSSRRRLTQIEVYALLGIGLVVIAEVLAHFTHWEKRTCYALTTFATLMTMNIVIKGSKMDKVLRGAVIAAVLLFVYFVWR